MQAAIEIKASDVQKPAAANRCGLSVLDDDSYAITVLRQNVSAAVTCIFLVGCPTCWREISIVCANNGANYNHVAYFMQVIPAFLSMHPLRCCAPGPQASALKPVLRTTGPHLSRSPLSSWANSAWVPVVT